MTSTRQITTCNSSAYLAGYFETRLDEVTLKKR